MFSRQRAKGRRESAELRGLANTMVWHAEEWLEGWRQIVPLWAHKSLLRRLDLTLRAVENH